MRKPMRKIFGALLLALALPALAAQSGTTTRSAELRATPNADGKLLATLPAGARVDVVKRIGGWYEVKTASGTAGWVRMWLLRFTGTATNVATLQSGRSSSTYTTATTGVRGLSEEELKNAKPDPAALQTVENLAVAPADARGFAQKASLKASPTFMKEAP